MFSRSQYGFVMVALACLALGGCDKGKEKEKSTGTSGGPAPQQATVPSEPIATTPQALVKEFLDNSAAANAKYPRLTPFKITGVVSGFGIDTLKIKSEDKDDQFPVDCTFAESDQKKIKSAKRGDAMTVTGKLNTFDKSRKCVELIGCKVIE